MDELAYLLGDVKIARSPSEYLEELVGKQAGGMPQPQSARLAEEATKANWTYIPYPFGLSPAQLATLFFTDPTHHACCVLKARALLVNEWRFVRVDGLPETPPAELFRRLQEVFPDGLDSVLYPAALDYEAVGNAYLEVIRKPDARYRDGLGPVAYVVHVPAFSVYRLPAGHPTGCAYVQIYGGKEIYFREFGQPEPRSIEGQDVVTELLHVKNFGGQSIESYWYGIPDIIAALPALYGLKKAMEYLAGYMSSKGVPNYLLILNGAGGAPNAIDFSVVNRYFNEALEKGPGKIVVIPTPPGVEAYLQGLSVGYAPREVIAFIHECRDQIVRAHGVPLRLLSILQAGQLGSSAESQVQLEFFRRYVVRPRQAMWERIVTKLIIGDNASLQNWTIRFGELTIEDVLREMQADILGVRFGVLTPNEARIKRGLKPIPGGDEALIIAGGNPDKLGDIVGLTGSLLDAAEQAREEEEKDALAQRPGLVIQSLRLDKEYFPTLEDAVRWAEEHGFHGKPDEESPGRYWRIRIRDPDTCRENSFRTIQLRPGVLAIVCRPVSGGKVC